MSRRSALRWIWIVVTSLVVVAAAGTPFFLKTGREALPARDEGPPLVKSEEQYYVLLAVLEVDPKKEEDSDWDTGGSAPETPAMYTSNRLAPARRRDRHDPG